MPMRLVLIASVTAGVGVRVTVRAPGRAARHAGVTPAEGRRALRQPYHGGRRPGDAPCSTSDWAVDGIASARC